MGSLPDLSERSRPPRAARTSSAPTRDRTLRAPSSQPVRRKFKTGWPWLAEPPRPPPPPPPPPHKRQNSVASSLGAASIRRLIHRQPPKMPRTVVRRFSLLCVASGLCATALLPFTAFVGAEAGGAALAVMHGVAACVAPFSPFILQKTGSRAVIGAGHALVCVLVAAHAVATPLAVLYALYAATGLALSPLCFALSAAATSLAQAAGEECRRRAVLRRALRALRAAQDLGLLAGAALLAAALALWPEDAPRDRAVSRFFFNASSDTSPVESYFSEEDYEEQTCGASGCPETLSLLEISVSPAGRRVLLGAWAVLALVSAGLGALGAAPAPSPPPDARSVLRDPRTYLGIPMGLFIGLQQGFIYTSYMKWYGVCVGGWWCAAQALGGAGALQACAAATLSMAAARGRRGALAAGGGAAHASLLLALLRWRAARTDLALPAVAAAAWGACAALWDVLQIGLSVGGAGWRGPWAVTLGARHAGLALSCAARQLVCARSQLGALAVALVLALAGHAALELRARRADTRHRS